MATDDKTPEIPEIEPTDGEATPDVERHGGIRHARIEMRRVGITLCVLSAAVTLASAALIAIQL